VQPTNRGGSGRGRGVLAGRLTVRVNIETHQTK
jgi:hypothetical protein